MIRKYLLPLLAVAGFVFAVRTVMSQAQPVIAAPPVAPAAQSGFSHFVAGAGIVEASTENIAVGTPVPGLVTEVFVKVGSDVAVGDPLFKLDDRSLLAELAVQEAALVAAQSQIERMQQMPRAEEVPLAEARVRQAEVNAADAKNTLTMRESVTDKRAISEELVRQARFASQSAEARLRESKADLALVKAGAWEADLRVAEAEVRAAEARLQAVRTEIERLTVRALVQGRVLQLKVRVGEYAPAGVLQTPLLVLGNVDTLHVRVDVDEHDAWRIAAGAPAEAFVRGNSSLRAPLEFVGFEPYVVPKRSLTGDSTERVDTRVLQVIYALDPKVIPIYVGQQVDVFIEGAPSLGAEGGEAPPAPQGA